MSEDFTATTEKNTTTSDQGNSPTEESVENNDGKYHLTPEAIDGEEVDYLEEKRQMDDLVRGFPRPTVGKNKNKTKRYSCLSHLLQLVMGCFDKLRT